MNISKDDYYKVIGLLVIGKDYVKKSEDVIVALRNLLKDEDDSGHCSDALYCDYTADELLERLGITIEEEPPKTGE